jgi:hypothetical protein
MKNIAKNKKKFNGNWIPEKGDPGKIPGLSKKNSG